jgi:hypothetical protein
MPWRHMGEWRYSSTILDPGTRWRWVVKFMPRSFYPHGNSPWYQLNRRLGGPQSRSGRNGARGSVVGWVTVLQAVWSRVRFPIHTPIVIWPAYFPYLRNGSILKRQISLRICRRWDVSSRRVLGAPSHTSFNCTISFISFYSATYSC